MREPALAQMSNVTASMMTVMVKRMNPFQALEMTAR